MFNKAKAKEILSKADGAWVGYKDRLVTNWGTGIFELETWENKNYHFSTTESIEIALRFLEEGCALYA